jgi:hypothetical protein
MPFEHDSIQRNPLRLNDHIDVELSCRGVRPITGNPSATNGRVPLEKSSSLAEQGS